MKTLLVVLALLSFPLTTQVHASNCSDGDHVHTDNEKSGKKVGI